ncbi:MAG: o-succinylbenzoate synthase [Bacillus sp. (in: firmicutes)]
MKIEEVTLRKMKMGLNTPFTTSYGTMSHKECILVEVRDADGYSGWAEAVAFEAPWYTEETVKTSWHMLEDFLVPALLGKEICHPDRISELFAFVKRNRMAKAGLECAVWDLYARRQNIPLWKAVGGRRQTVEVGIAIGIQDSTSQLFSKINKAIESGYRRVKLKIKPGQDIEPIRAVRTRFPELAIMADANSAYTLNDIDRLKELDDFDLMMIEQPLAHDDLVDHAVLQSQIKTPICLDESITSFEDARKAIDMASCRVINMKIGRVGGISEAIRIHDFCQQKGIAIWCGGMLESGIGRAHNIAISTLPGFCMPGDTAASSNYWQQDIIKPEVTVENGLITVSCETGIGYGVDLDCIHEQMEYCKVFRQ